MLAVEVDNRSGKPVEADAAVELAQRVLAGEGIEDGELGLHFVSPEEIRALKREHLGVDEATDVLAFPLDAHDEVPDGVPRQLGDAFVCPDVVGDDWRRPLVHALLHLLGHDHGPEMEARERIHEP
jgi:probable rRNA maturation factor